jgi:hypothetical protein
MLKKASHFNHVEKFLTETSRSKLVLSFLCCIVVMAVLSACQPDKPKPPILSGSFYCIHLEMSTYTPEGQSVEAVNICDGYQTIYFDGVNAFRAEITHRCSKDNSIEHYLMNGEYEVDDEGSIEVWDPQYPEYKVHGKLLNGGNIILGDGHLTTAAHQLAQQGTCVRIVEEGFPR